MLVGCRDLSGRRDRWAGGTPLGRSSGPSTTRTPETSLSPRPGPVALGLPMSCLPGSSVFSTILPLFSSPQVPMRLPPSSGDAPDEPRESQNARPSDLRLCDAGRTSSESGAAPHCPSQDESCRVSQPVIDPRSWGALAHTYRGWGPALAPCHGGGPSNLEREGWRKCSLSWAWTRPGAGGQFEGAAPLGRPRRLLRGQPLPAHFLCACPHLLLKWGFPWRPTSCHRAENVCPLRAWSEV